MTRPPCGKHSWGLLAGPFPEPRSAGPMSYAVVYLRCRQCRQTYEGRIKCYGPWTALKAQAALKVLVLELWFQQVQVGAR